MKNNKIKHILKAIASGLVWGLGQLLNKQYLKALFFFIFFALFVFIEVGTSKYIKGFDPYQDKLIGEDFSDEEASNFYLWYTKNADGKKYKKLPEFEEAYAKYMLDGEFTMDELIQYTANDLQKGSPEKYYKLSELIKTYKKGDEFLSKSYSGDLFKETDLEKISTFKDIKIASITWLNPETGEQYERRLASSTEEIYRYYNINNAEDVLELKDIEGFPMLEKRAELFYKKTDPTQIYVLVNTNGKASHYVNVVNSEDILYASSNPSIPEGATIYKAADYPQVPARNGSFLTDGTDVYVYFNPENNISKYLKTDFSIMLTDFFKSRYEFSQYNQEDFARLKLKIYFEMHQDVKEDFEERFDNFFSDRAGFFIKGFWSVITLGSTNTVSYYQISLLNNALDSQTFKGGSTPLEKIEIRGHISSMLLISGLIAVLLICYFAIFLIWNVKDAYRTSVLREEGKHVPTTKEYFKGVYEGSFEYIVLLPALFTITFVSIMPILFSFLVAFTSYSGNEADAGLFDWVGFRNFAKIFVFGGDIPFGKVFWKVFVWTVIWAIASTATVFFGGFLQAVIINSERVPMKKFWRTLYILPWAIPAIITQMVFANIFNESGVVNTLLKDLGAYDLFTKWGILGKAFNEIGPGIQRIFYLGHDNIQWFTNPYNPWFVRIVLIIVNIWIGFPYYMALMTGVMVGIDETLYEAADIDGATKKQKFKYITFPLVMYSTAPLLVMSFSGNFNNFGMIYFVTQGGAHAGDIAYAYAGDTDILISWMYSLTVNYKNYNMASVFSIIIFFIVGSIAAWNYSRTKAFKED